MKQISFLLIVLFLTAISCSESKDNSRIKSLNKKSKIVFYTNTQAILNCGTFDVDVYIDNILVGSISETYINDSIPSCSQNSNTLLIEKDSGTYNYLATANCNKYIEWVGTITMKPDTCYRIFLDIEKALSPDITGYVLFYTNAQFVLNCGPFDVDLYIDSVLIGTLIKPFLPVDSIPSCDEIYDEEEILKVQEEEGNYSYYALLNCSKYGICEGEFNVAKDSCTRVFLDINKCQTLK